MTDVRTAGAQTTSRPTVTRRDIQGLRTIAVAAVVLYHLWPKRLTGGYVGVDIFFVISGFLITTHLLRTPIRTPRDILAFWGRRIRRLIPAATLVLLVTLLVAFLVLPETTRGGLAREVGAAALYGVNWLLASNATDYLAAADSSTPVQHYWSLSIEEQFYVIWPVLLGGAGLAGWSMARARRWSVGAVTAVFVLSLVWSVSFTARDPQAAYFVSTTRFWELALGGLVAVGVGLIRVRHGVVQAMLGWIGLALIAYSVLTFTGDTPFPSGWALLPTVGTALVIVADADDVAWSPSRILSWRSVQYVGDVSYSIYLWHWPLIILVPAVVGHLLAWPEKLVLLVATLGLAALSKTLVEDPIRRSRRLNGRIRETFVLLVACVSVVVVAAGLVALKADRDTTAASASAQEAQEEAGDCFGAGAATHTTCDYRGAELLTAPEFAAADRPASYADECIAYAPYSSHLVCTYGDPDAETRVALIGNSHASHWLPALLRLAAENDWSVTTYILSTCPTVDVPVAVATEEQSQNCQEWTDWATGAINDGGYDLVVMSDLAKKPFTGVSAEDYVAVARDSYGRVLDSLAASQTPLVVIRDIPRPASDVPDCVASHLDDLAACATPQVQALYPDPLAEAAADRGIGVVDVNSVLCRDGSCPAVIGGVVVYFDASHLTATFSESLAPMLERPLLEALGS